MSPSYDDMGAIGDHAANMSTPGAVKSGCRQIYVSQLRFHQISVCTITKQKCHFTLRTSAVMGFGPREENETAYGAAGSPTVWLFCMFAVGWLSNNQKKR